MINILKIKRHHPVWVNGYSQPGAGWSVSTKNDPDARLLNITVQIQTTDGTGFLVLAESDDKSVYCDDWCKNIEDADQLAKEEYGINSWDD